MKTVVRSTLILALSLASTLVAAGVAHADTNTSSVKVSLSGLDLSSSQGLSVARDRIHKAARTACARAEDPTNLVPSFEYASCIASSEQRALQQIQAASIVAKK